MTVQQIIDYQTLGRFIIKALDSGRVFSISIDEDGYTTCVFKERIYGSLIEKTIVGRDPLKTLQRLSQILGVE